ncbi:MAG: glycosyltransferase family 2 protein [Myxococcota bacterium]|jgi:glycosyltransferase involved in cell wall biosynthesis|nr:lipopolysaccharide biosynthesis protein [Deltaproteobacteria bacterium]MCP4241803.1 glycosyltransferase family 2 protein [bacterium]MDP6074152.1 glycosyltransferase family 2 protein [Myxococcota bacterium]MDP6241777.1 glycosyltransferase family 2 protein [Myxococcota bacterium]MDP7074587.1 glycosyltransferase family 2 protein [Myxococcota bacterium]
MSESRPGATSAGHTPLSACVIAQDEADRIGACLESLAFCDEIVVIDAHSTDATREIASASGARVIERDWPGYIAQKDFAVREAKHDWVLCIDADERISDGLRDEIEALRKRGFPDRPGWRMPRLSSYLGRWIRHGSWYPNRQLRLFDRRRGHWAGLELHERVALDAAPGTLRGDLLHHPYRDLSDHLARIDRYSTIQADLLFERGRRAHVSDLVLRPAWRFVRFYLLDRGLLEGWRGFVLACMAAHYVRLRWLKLWLLAREDLKKPAA